MANKRKYENNLLFTKMDYLRRSVMKPTMEGGKNEKSDDLCTKRERINIYIYIYIYIYREREREREDN